MDLVGFYSDPLHGNCLRHIRLSSKRGNSSSSHTYVIEGAYGDDEAPRRSGEAWNASLYRQGKFLTVDFEKKRVDHARVYSALWCPGVREIHWEDGNVWTKLYARE